MKLKKFFLVFLSVFILIFSSSCEVTDNSLKKIQTEYFSDISEIPKYTGEAFVCLNGNVPFFTEEDFSGKSFEEYGELDYLNRCGVAFSKIGPELMPTEERGPIGQVKPSGWQISKYDFVDGKYLYNRCHLIGFQLTGENANEKNLITGTRYLNVEGMLPFENMVADYIKETKNHVLYRVTPVFEGINLIASGVIMEAMSVEDNGDGILFNVYCYNVQPGVKIDYKTGDNEQDSEYEFTQENKIPQNVTYVLNKNSLKLHRVDCESVSEMKEKNKVYLGITKAEALKKGYIPCASCNP